MTIEKACKGISFIGKGTYRIGFNGDDETEFDASSRKELGELWRDFCEENNFKTSSVDYVERA